VLVNTIRHEPLRPVLLAVVHVLGTALQTINRFGTTSGLLMLAMTVLTIFIVCLPANALMRRYPAWHGRIFVVAVVILEAQIVPSALWRESLVPGSGTVAWAITQVVAGVLIILLTSGFGSWQQQRRATQRTYLQDLDQELVITLARSRAVAELARELSRTLHGTVQSKIVACAMVSEQAIESGNVEQLKDALEQAQRVLVSSREQEKAPVGAVAEVRRKVALWDELCAIDVQIDAGIDHSTGSGERVGRVVEEGLANAIRHGGATAITVALKPVDGGIRIVIDDDGTGPPSALVPGLGSTVLDQATGGRWSLTALPHGARLEAIVSPRPADAVV
jgi:signal transduction histidine kinase